MAFTLPRRTLTSVGLQWQHVDMPEPMPQHFAQRWSDNTRQQPPMTGDDRALLTGYLDWYRGTFELKCGGVPPERLSERGVPPSRLSLHGLVRHLAGVERWWFRIRFAGEEVPMLHYSDDDPDQDFERLDGDVTEALARWRAECDASRAVVASADSLDQTGVRTRDGQPFSLRSLLVSHIGEYAHHCGHADLLRERIDGRTGH